VVVVVVVVVMVRVWTLVGQLLLLSLEGFFYVAWLRHTINCVALISFFLIAKSSLLGRWLWGKTRGQRRIINMIYNITPSQTTTRYAKKCHVHHIVILITPAPPIHLKI
jgi:hypothetical protein